MMDQFKFLFDKSFLIGTETDGQGWRKRVLVHRPEHDANFRQRRQYIPDVLTKRRFGRTIVVSRGRSANIGRIVEPTSPKNQRRMPSKP